jgi:2-phosphosulfolactate phosphatase
MVFHQGDYDIRCEWGEDGMLALSQYSDVVIIVDILSFSTGVNIAVENGASVYPYRYMDDRALDYAREIGAILAHPDRHVTGFSISPQSLQHLPENARVVLPSTDGATLALLAGHTPALTGCLRNARAVANAAMKLGKGIAVIAAGERWPLTNALRPALEDWLGAGAIIHFLQGSKSVEARVAEAIFVRYRDNLLDALSHIGSGLELIEQGFGGDVMLSAQFNVSDVAPLLIDGAFASHE